MILHCDDGIRHVEAVLEEPTNQVTSASAMMKGRGYLSGHRTNSLRAIHPATGNIAHMLLGRDTFAASDVLLIELIIGIQTAHLLFVVLLNGALLNVIKEALSNWRTE